MSIHSEARRLRRKHKGRISIWHHILKSMGDGVWKQAYDKWMGSMANKITEEDNPSTLRKR